MMNSSLLVKILSRGVLITRHHPKLPDVECLLVFYTKRIQPIGELLTKHCFTIHVYVAHK